MFDMKKVGRQIAQLRKVNKITQMKLADQLGVSFQAISNWERGETMPDISKLPELAEIFNVSIDEILGNEKGVKLINNLIEK
ncbi:helix-turn-helix domain-containing protein, partial [Gottfriedia acidiceleris]|uniref:helix-turn-helix domain-containing protein n=1 Tax=Gottfriedia acidiceleris TaxID=371036 RepID=UPI003000030B